MTDKALNGGTWVNLTDADLDLEVHRTYSFARFVDMLTKGTDALVSPGKWDDPFENFLLAHTQVQVSPTELATLDSLAADWYGQCWTLDSDSDAMWRIYSHEHTGIKATTTIRKLFDNMVALGSWSRSNQCFVGKVRYWSESEIKDHMNGLVFADVAIGGQGDGFAELLCVKRKAFAHENEVRLLFQDVSPQVGGGGAVIYPLDVNKIFDSIQVDPRLSPKGGEAIVKGLEAIGLRIPASRSTLYDTPTFIIPLQ